MELMEEEEKEYQTKNTGDKDGGYDDWETVEALGVPSIGNGEKAPKEWDGIVGFLHPFWYVLWLSRSN